jgi:hypothetical protein
MSSWLFDSKGNPIAYLSDTDIFNPESDRDIFSLFGTFLGKLNKDNEIWKRIYRGEVHNKNRLYVKASLKTSIKPRNLYNEVPRSNPIRPPIPDAISKLALPQGFEDIDIMISPQIEESWSHILKHDDKYFSVFLRHPPIDSATALDCLVSTLKAEDPTFKVSFTENDTYEEAKLSLRKLENPTPTPMSKEQQEFFDKPVLPSLFGGVAIAMMILGAFSILQMLLHPNG